MKSKFLGKREKKFKLSKSVLRKTFIIPTLSLIMLGAEYVPQLFFSNQAVVNLMNELPSTAVVQAAPLTKKELEEYPDEAVKAKDMEHSVDINEERTLVTQAYCINTGKSEVYYSTMGYTNHAKFRQAMIEEYGEEFLFLEGANSTVSSTYYQWKEILQSKSKRAKLAKIASKYLPNIKSSDVAAPEVAIATFYGAINDPWNYSKYDAKASITRCQMASMVYRIQKPNYTDADVAIRKELAEAMGKNNKYNLILSAVTEDMYGGVKYTARNGRVVGKYDKKAMNSSATRKEVIYLAMETYHQSGWGLWGTDAQEAKRVKKARQVFSDLDKASELDCLIAYRAYELGIIKPDKNGKSNLNKKCSMSLALRYCFAAQGANVD